MTLTATPTLSLYTITDSEGQPYTLESGEVWTTADLSEARHVLASDGGQGGILRHTYQCISSAVVSLEPAPR